jgi:hypothetical protein
MSRIFVVITKGIKGFMDKKDDSDNENNNEEDTFIIKFKEIYGDTIIISVNPEHSMEDAFKKYLIQKDIAESKNINSLIFIYNGQKIDNNTKIKVKDFLVGGMPIINVLDRNNIIGA